MALVLGVIFGYLSRPIGNPWILFGGLACVVIAIVLDGIAYNKIPAGGSRAVVKGIVEAHNGKLAVCNENGGARFTMRIPFGAELT